MQARGFTNYHLKHCWPEVIYCMYLGLSAGIAGILLLI